MVRVRVRVRVNPYPNPNPNPNRPEENPCNQSEARIPDLSYEKKKTTSTLDLLLPDREEGGNPPPIWQHRFSLAAAHVTHGSAPPPRDVTAALTRSHRSQVSLPSVSSVSPGRADWCMVPRSVLTLYQKLLLPSVLSSRAAVVMKPQVVFVLGGPGAGKGTQCTKITEVGNVLTRVKCDPGCTRDRFDSCDCWLGE